MNNQKIFNANDFEDQKSKIAYNPRPLIASGPSIFGSVEH